MKKQALISVFKKDGIVEFARELTEKYNYEILSTGGTAELLRKNNISVTEVSEKTKFPEMLEGRVKTLHPVIHGGLLARRDKPEHMETIAKHDIKPIDIVVINLYPFEEVVSKSSVSLEDAIENIDIGGPSMIRSAAKNYSAVTVICDSTDYNEVLNDLKQNKGQTTLNLREKLAIKAFQKTSLYDSKIYAYLGSSLNAVNEKSNNGSYAFPENINLNLKLKTKLRYGENPHQRAALYVPSNSQDGLANAEVLQGKELSFNNYLDLNSAWEIACEFNVQTPVCVIVKHNNPCGVAIAPDLHHAYIEAFNCDTVSAFGGIVAFNNKVDKSVADELTKIFLEAIIAPDYSPEALEEFKKKPNLRVLKIKVEIDNSHFNEIDIKRIGQGFLVQDNNIQILIPEDLKVVTKRKPTEAEMLDLIFAWKVCKHVKSNAIVIAKEGKTIGIGAGQCNRVGSVEIALNQASYNSKNAVLSSDAFFPFKDSIEVAAGAKISAIIQPGGSIKDKEVIEACDKFNIAMMFTGMRHFRH
ncbi:MAG: bifunctional phosphoribosylaminoimidazolecarboxamide formyltransferase/IMP cyclohydrolase [Candidatus Melainabacteria bacterium RIFCSPHIGHO2_02_FULL_34_12]|nr:MAG: bifunctional phosphoribosylaminoimidazolecarboxamide formyltransferase/IMP cyclohydrolase [Candidatus Melainabacteria bacterium RIFCSPHIGHO2_02_FULL_34_12]